MTEWIFPCSPKFYRLKEALSDLKILDWRRTNNTKNIKAGDLVYIYVSSPVCKIAYKGAVLKAYKEENTIDDSLYTIPPGSGTHDDVMELAVFRAYNIDGLDIKSLKANGLTSNLQCAITVKPDVANYLHACDKMQREADEVSGERPAECLHPFPLTINEDEIDINTPLSPLKISEDGKTIICRNCYSSFRKAKRCTVCAQLILYPGEEERVESESISFQSQFDKSGLIDENKWIDDPRSGFEVLYGPLIEGTEYYFERNTTDSSTKIIELHKRGETKRIMGFSGKRDFSIRAFLNQDFYDYIVLFMDLPEDEKDYRSQPHINIRLKTVWNILCVATGKHDLLVEE